MHLRGKDKHLDSFTLGSGYPTGKSVSFHNVQSPNKSEKSGRADKVSPAKSVYSPADPGWIGPDGENLLGRSMQPKIFCLSFVFMLISDKQGDGSRSECKATDGCRAERKSFPFRAISVGSAPKEYSSESNRWEQVPSAEVC